MKRFPTGLAVALLLISALIFTLPIQTLAGDITVTFEAGTAAGWDFYDLDGNIFRDNIVDFNDLDILTGQWLNDDCAIYQWCDGADIDGSNDVDFVDYALLAKDWTLTPAEDVLLQTIYGTSQDSNGTITSNNIQQALVINKGLAIAFAVEVDTTLDKAIFKCVGRSGIWRFGEQLQIRLFNVTGMDYLTFGHTMSRANPGGAGNDPIFDITAVTPNPVPYHEELGDGRQYSDMVLDFGLLGITAGEYLLTFDPLGPSNTWGSIVSGNSTEAETMGQYPDGNDLPKRAIVTTGPTTQGNCYYYELDAIDDPDYTPRSFLFAFQILKITVNLPPQVDAGESQIIVDPDNNADLDGTVSDDGLPDPPGAVTTLWTKESGPGTVTFGDVNAVDTTATFSDFGEYTLRLTADDSNQSAYDEVTITYYESLPENQPPDVNAGFDQQITLPSNATLDGTVTDDGLPDPPATVTVLWTKENGPGSVTFGNTAAVDTTASFSQAGTYVLRLTADDSEFQSYDELTVTVNPVGTYEGYAPLTTGGDGGTVVWVDTLSDSGTGSFRAAIDGLTGAPTTIKFSVGGTINVLSEITLVKPNVTIAGETAPAPGITLDGSNLTTGDWLFKINTHDVIVRHMRFRNTILGTQECIQVDGDYNLIFDHCSISGALDGALDINGGTHHIIVSRCLFADNVEVHRSYGKYASLHHNLYTYNNRRQPKIVDAIGPYDFRNNVVEYWTNTGTNIEIGHNVNIINNNYGPLAPGETCNLGFAIALGSDNIYTNGNISSCGQDIDSMGDRGTPVEEPSVTTMAAGTALVNDVKGDCGAMPRDAFDESYAGPASP